MPCVSQTCRQGRAQCRTPYTCNYANDSYDAAMHAGYLPREQAAATSLMDRPRWSWSFLAWLVAALVAVWLVVVYVPWPRLAWMLGSL